MCQREELEYIYQDIAAIIGKADSILKIDDKQYPKLIIEDITSQEKYEIIIKKFKKD
jgi:Uma2 family endonuclease